MQLMTTDASPFFVLWQFFVTFFGIVVVINIICLIVGRILQWRIRAMYEYRRRGRRA